MTQKTESQIFEKIFNHQFFFFSLLCSSRFGAWNIATTFFPPCLGQPKRRHVVWRPIEDCFFLGGVTCKLIFFHKRYVSVLFWLCLIKIPLCIQIRLTLMTKFWESPISWKHLLLEKSSLTTIPRWDLQNLKWNLLWFWANRLTHIHPPLTRK